MLFGKPLAKMQVTQFKFVDMMIQITAAQELYLRLHPQAMRAARTRRCEISMAKVFCGRRARSSPTTASSSSAAPATCTRTRPAAPSSTSRLVSIGGGADETMKQYLAKMLGI